MAETQDFDAWRATENAKRRSEAVNIFGQQVPVPTSISLDLSMRIDEADLEDHETLQALTAELYGEGELKRWRDAGCTTREFGVLLTWGRLRAEGTDTTFDKVADMLARQQAEVVEGKAPEGNRAQRRAAKKSRR